MSEQSLSSLPFETPTAGSVIDTAQIASDHPGGADIPKTRKPRADKGIRRPRQSGMGGDTQTDQSGSQQTSVGGGVALSPETRNQVITAIKSLISVVDDRCTKLIQRTAERITQDKAFALQLADDNKMSDTERESISTLTVVVVEKYNLLGTYAPEAMLGLAIIGYSYRIHSTLTDLKKFAAEKAAAGAPGTPPNGLPAPAPTVVNNG